MKNKLQQFCLGLENLDASENFGVIVDLYDLVELIKDEEDISAAFEPIFRFFEKYPDADVGNPGPLVHLMERHYSNYINALLSSVKSKPTYMSVIMLHRVLILGISDQARVEYIELLEAVATNKDSDEGARYVALECCEYHKTTAVELENDKDV